MLAFLRGHGRIGHEGHFQESPGDILVLLPVFCPLQLV